MIFMKKLLVPLVLFFGCLFFNHLHLNAQIPEVIVKEVHPQLDLVPAEEMRVAGYSFKQKGYNKGGFDAHFTSCMLWVKPLMKAPFSEKVANKFSEDFETGEFTPFLYHFAVDTRKKQLEAADKTKYKQLEMGDPSIQKIKGNPAIVIPYKFKRDDNKLLKTVEKTNFIGRRAIVFMGDYLTEIIWEYVPDENEWNNVCLEQIELLLIK